VKLAPAEADLRGRLGIARVNAGRPAEAVGDFEEAIRLRPDVPEMHEQFAQVLRALGRNAEALARLERAAELRRPGAR
jgi:Flp pilus assembly protein TadD